MKFRSVFLATTLCFPSLAHAQTEACTQIAGILDEAVEEWPDLLSTARVKPRLAATKIATSAGVTINYAIDEGWPDDALAPIVALRDTREADPADPAFAKDKMPALLHGYLTEIADMLATQCPDTDLADISDLSLDYPKD